MRTVPPDGFQALVKADSIEVCLGNDDDGSPARSATVEMSGVLFRCADADLGSEIAPGIPQGTEAYVDIEVSEAPDAEKLSGGLYLPIPSGCIGFLRVRKRLDSQTDAPRVEFPEVWAKVELALPWEVLDRVLLMSELVYMNRYSTAMRAS